MAMIDIVDRLRFDAVRCEVTFSKGVAGNISEAADEIERLRVALGELKTLGEQGMKPDYSEWLTFHDKVAKIATDALNQQRTASESDNADKR